MIRKQNKGGLFYKQKQRSVRKYIIMGLMVTLVGLGLSVLISEKTPSVNAGSTENTITSAVVAVPYTGTDAIIEASTLVKSTAARGDVQPLIDKFSVNLTVDGETKSYNFIGRATVDDLIKKSGVNLEDLDEISMRGDMAISEGDTIQVVRVTTETVEENVETPFETEYVEDATMTKGSTLVMQEGVNRITKNVYTVTYKDGAEASRELERTEVTQEGKKKIVAKGTKEEPAPQSQPTQSQSQSGANTSSPSTSQNSGASTTPQNQESTSTETSSNTIAGYSYSKVLTCTAFAYTAPAGACGYSGKPAVEGTCAVDKSVIPIGTRLYIEGYGYAVANDIGGGIIGNTVDVFYDTYDECVNWGRRTVKVYILD